MPLVAGVDTSTQATKVLVVDTEDGTVVASGRAGHTVAGDEGARETDPEQWWEALARALDHTGRASEVAAISVGGQQHGLVVLDGEGRPIRPAKLWNDTQSAPEAERLRGALGGPEAWASRVGLVPVASFTVTKWAWLRRHEPDAARRTAAIRLPHDFITERLTGRGVTDRSDASGTGWWSTATEGYLPEVLDLPDVDLDPVVLPIVLGPTDPAGEVTSSVADALGIRPGIPVGPGAGDNAGAALGLGLEPGTPVVSLGTSGTAYMVSTSRIVDPTGTVAGFADAGGRFLPLAATLNCTLAVDRVAGWLGIDREAVADHTEAVVLPFFDGERTPDLPRASATITGLRHTTEPDEILLAAYEGAALSLLDALDAIHVHSSGLDQDAPLVLIGGGARGDAWRRVIGRLSGRVVLVPGADELVALGAAAQAAALLTGETPGEVARRWGTLAGTRLEAVERDEETLDRIRRVRSLTEELNRA
jgi:xylulokinase